MEPLRVGVVGGGIGVAHIEAYQSLPTHFQVLAFCDLDRVKGREIVNKFGIPHFLSDFENLCQMKDLDVIDICTPSYLHYSQVLQGLAGGKHVICEKPMAGSLQEVDDLIQAEADSGKRVMPIFQYRFGHGLQKLKKLVDAGIAGQAYFTTVETAWRRNADYYAVPWRGKWETELGGATLTLAIHAHDTLVYILGPAKSVYARAGTLVNRIETEDNMSASLEMVDGSLVNLAVTTGSVHQISRHRFCFANLSAESNTKPYSNTSDPWQFSAESPEIEEQIEESLANFKTLPESFPGQFLRFYHALESGNEIPVTLMDARISLELITAIYLSARTKQSVPLPIGPENPFYERWYK
jgi:predicted dehydrogenase